MMKISGSRIFKLTFIPVVALIAVVAVIIVSLSEKQTSVSAHDLMEGFKANTPQTLTSEQSNALKKPMADFSVKLLQNSLESGKNTLVSPLSVSLALGMTGNGAAGETRAEFEKVLAGGVSMNDLNSFYYELADRLTSLKSEKINIVNSIWYKESDALKIKPDFLQINADYYGASAYQENFNDPAVIKKMNGWVSKKTNGVIKNIVDQIRPDSIMFLINALYFEGKWESEYKKEDVHDKVFHSSSGDMTVPFMYSEESRYIEDNGALGFIKPYKGNNISFVALLPKEGTSVEEYLSDLTGEKLQNLLQNSKEGLVLTSLPKFETEYKITLNDSLKSMGLVKGFDDSLADFSAMGTSSSGNIFIGEVRHKTFMKVTETGTVAGAVTSVEMRLTGMPQYLHEIILNRPFLYLLVDNKTNLPLFFGVMQNPKVK